LGFGLVSPQTELYTIKYKHMKHKKFNNNVKFSQKMLLKLWILFCKYSLTTRFQVHVNLITAPNILNKFTDTVSDILNMYAMFA